MATKLFVGSLAWGTTDDSLKDLFASVGTVVSASVIMDRETNRSKGFGFVEMSSDDEAKAAVDQLNNKELDGRTIIVNEARPREERPRTFGGGQGGGGGGYNRDNRGGNGGGSRGGDNRW
jgi:RNA recognition motif-containing protein